MKLEFVKLNGLGNDFVFIDDLSGEINLTEHQVQWLCDRNFGIGADGVILVRQANNDDALAYMHYINSDGSLAQMCGNGVRCFAKYLIDRGFNGAGNGSFIAETLAGNKEISYTVDSDNKMTLACVNMGEPILDPALVPVNISATATTVQGNDFVKEATISSPWGDFAFTCVSMGNPHAICFVDNWEALPDELFTDPSHKNLKTFRINEIGAFYEANPVFPEKTNVEFASIADNGIEMRVFERGCGETLACGTGACATAVAAILTGKSHNEVTVHLLGGDLQIAWNPDGKTDNDKSVFMTGPALESFAGVVEV